jgi:hypothetical protein
MSLLNEENDNMDRSPKCITEFKKHVSMLIDNCVHSTAEISLIQLNIILFDYLVETHNFWKNEKSLEKFNLTVKNKLLEYKDNITQKFPADKYLKLLGYRCSYETRSTRLCKNSPVNGICDFHRKFDYKLKLNVTDSTPLIKDLQDIIINYIR